VVVVSVIGGGEKFLDGKISKTTTVGLYNLATTLLSYLRHLYDPTWMHSI
jgi:hypothetical protein